MFGIIIYDILFFAIPAIIIALLGVSIYRYLILLFRSVLIKTKIMLKNRLSSRKAALSS